MKEKTPLLFNKFSDFSVKMSKESKLLFFAQTKFFDNFFFSSFEKLYPQGGLPTIISGEKSNFRLKKSQKTIFLQVKSYIFFGVSSQFNAMLNLAIATERKSLSQP